MKRRLTQTLLAAIASVGVFSACTGNFENGRPNNGGEGVFVEMYASVVDQDGTRASITIGDSRFTGDWAASDQLGVSYTAPSSTATYTDFTYNADSKSFGGTLTGDNGSWKYNAFYPHVYGTTGTTAKVPFGSGRLQNGASYNSAYDVMVSDVVTCAASDPGKTPTGDPVMFKMNRLTSILAFSLSSSTPEVSGAKVKLVKITADKPIAAQTLNFNYDMTGEFDATKADVKLDSVLQSTSIVLTYEEGTEPSVADFKAFFNILPGNYTLKVDVLTDNNKMASFNVNRSDSSKPFVAGKLYTNSQTLSTWSEAQFSAPALTWANHDFTKRYELTDGLPIEITTNNEAGIAKFEIEITSAVLDELLPLMSLASNMDLVNPATADMEISLKTLGFPNKNEIRNSTNFSLDITKLMGMLYTLLEAEPVTSNHDFKMTITDNAGQSTSATVQLKYTAHAIKYAKDADLWNNTASFNIRPTTATTLDKIAVEYKRSTETTWQSATVTANGDNIYKATVSPEWITTTNEDGNAAQMLNNKKGIFAGATYDYRLKIDGTEIESGQFTTEAGNTIPDGSFENTWKSDKEFNGTSGSLGKPWIYDFWGSGYNSYAKELCTRDNTKAGLVGNYCAKLSATYNGTAKIPAPGNIFTANFKMSISPMGGYVTFGKKYEYNARPSAVKVKVHATIGNVTHNLYSGPIAVGQPDKGKISVSIVDWSSQREVFAGKKAPSGTWDPNKMASVDQGPIVGYASKYITSTAGDSMEYITIPIYYNKNGDAHVAAAPEGNYTIVFNCSTSAYGDYMNACTTNAMYIDDFQWVY